MSSTTSKQKTPLAEPPEAYGFRKVSRNQWTCDLCSDYTKHYTRHLSRHLESNRHKQSVRFRGRASLMTDQDESEHASSMYVAQSSDEVNLNVDAPPTVNDTLAADEIAERPDHDLEDIESSCLHSIQMMAPDLDKGQMQLAVYRTGLLHAILKEFRVLSESCQADRAIMSDIHIRLEEPFALTPEQKMNIRLVAGEMLLDPNRVCYSQLSVDVESKIRERQKDLRFFNIFGNLARQRVLRSAIQRICSSLRNGYRDLLRNSVHGDNTSTLDNFATYIADRFASQMPLGHPFIAHVALLRRFTIEHPELLDQVAEDDNYNDEQADNLSQSASTHLGSPGQTEDGSRPSSVMSSVSQFLPRKRLNGLAARVTPQLKGTDFWSMVDMWFTARMQVEQFGTSWSTSGWTRYIEVTLKRDRAKFKSFPVGNLFLTDFTSDATGGGNNNGDVQVAARAIGSMQGILATL